MSWNAGAGAPGVFRCHRARRGEHPDGGSTDYTVELTGRTKPYTGKGHTRTSRTSREYRCSCGHVGWSNHRWLERLERAQAGAAGDRAE